VPLGLKNPKQVLRGWINDAKFEKGNLEPEFIEEIVRRRAICEVCPHNSKLHPPTERTDEHCTICKCPITKKTACLECNCGLDYWNLNNPDDQKELKWTYYIKKDE
jgi:hypothetical protein